MGSWAHGTRRTAGRDRPPRAVRLSRVRDPDGKPDVTPVWPAWVDDTVWINIFADSRKARNIARNPAIALHWQANEAGDGVELWGAATLHTDLDTKRRLWTGVFGYDLNQFYPEGPESPQACFVSVAPERGVSIKQFGAGGVDRWRAPS